MEKINKKEIIIFLIIVILAIFSRGYRLDSLPVGIHVDEAGMAYDAYSLATNGTDRWLNRFPVYLENFGGGQSALYAYLCAIFVKIFGLNMISIRLPAFLLSIITIIIVYYTVRKEYGIKSAQLLSFLIVIMPWYIMASRWGLDCNLFSSMIIISICLLINAKTVKGYIIAGLSFGLTLYTYAISYMILPIFLAITLIYMLYTKRIKWINLIPLGISIFILALPLMLMILVNNGIINEISSLITIPKLIEYRGAEINFSNLKNNIGFIKTMFTTDGLTYNALPEFGTVYRFSICLIFIGGIIEIEKFVKNIIKKKFEFSSIIGILFGVSLFCILLTDSPNINKANVIYIPMMFFILQAMRMFYHNSKTLFTVFMILFLISFCKFENFYFNNFETSYGVQKYFEKDYLEAIEYVNEKYEDKKVHVLTSTPEPYIYTLLVNKTDPKEFISGLHKETINDDLYSYNNYYFRDINLNGDEVCIVNFKSNYDLYLMLQNIGFIEDEQFSNKEYRIFYKED